VIIRSHGIPKETLHALQQKNITIIDATCPFVQKAQRIVQDLHAHNVPTLIIGEHDHPEVIAMRSYSAADTIVVNSLEALTTHTLPASISIVCQTTQPVEKLHTIEAWLSEHQCTPCVYNTICDATEKRQEEARQLAREVDVVLVIGGKNSANTRRLWEICHEVQPATHYIETADDLLPEYVAGKQRIGIITGASTPSWIIRRVLLTLRRIHE
jgi:4-hydroxy-3-methylbut-2-enyl diphosphate reductase